MSSRHYLFPEHGEPLRMSIRLVDGLIFGRDALPQFADTRQRVLSAHLELADGKPARIVRTQGSIWIFDDEGKIDEGLKEALGLAMEVAHEPRRTGTVVELRPKSARRKLEDQLRWEPDKSQIVRIIADIWPKRKSDRLKSVTGVSQRKPPLTWDARRALEEISSHFWKVSHEIEKLKEPSQKAFGFEARQRANSDPDYAPLYPALGEISDWHLEVQRRRRSGKGVWYAFVQVTRWDDDRVGHSVAEYYERCQSRSEAVRAARRLLREHAEKFSEDITVEAELLTDLEWEQRAVSD